MKSDNVNEFSVDTRRTGPSEDNRYQTSDVSEFKDIIENGDVYRDVASPGLGPVGGVTPTLPPDDVASPGLGPVGGVTPTLPSDDVESPELGPVGGVTPTLPPNDVALPGLGPVGGVTPTLPSGGVTVIPIIPSARYGYLRFFNGNVNGETIDIYIHNKLYARNLYFRESTDYFQLPAGSHKITVYRAGNRNVKLYEQDFRINANTRYTGAFSGEVGDYSMVFTITNCKKKTGNIARVRFINIAKNSPYFDVYLDKTVIIREFYYNEVSRYIDVRNGYHSLILTQSQTMRVLLEEPQVYFEGGRCYSVYILGNNSSVPVQISILEDSF